MAAPKRNRVQREIALAEVAAYYLSGVSQHQIAERQGVTRSQVQYDLRILRTRWHEAALRDFDERIAEELAKIDNLEREYWDAWERSTGRASAVTRERGGAPELPMSAAAARSKGNPGFLVGVQWCIDRRIKLLGIDAPVKVDITERVRAFALAQGFDPEEAVTEAQRIVREWTAARQA